MDEENKFGFAEEKEEEACLPRPDQVTCLYQ